MRTMKLIIFSAVFFLFNFDYAIGKEISTATIEKVAKSIADKHNENYKNYLDEITSASYATSLGSNVTFFNILRTKKNINKSELNNYDSVTRAKIIPLACNENANNEYFTAGLYYTFVFRSVSGVTLSKFDVTSGVCKALRES